MVDSNEGNESDSNDTDGSESNDNSESNDESNEESDSNDESESNEGSGSNGGSDSNEESDSNEGSASNDGEETDRKKRQVKLPKLSTNTRTHTKLKHFPAPYQDHLRKKRKINFKKRRVNAKKKKPEPTKLKRSNAANSRLGLTVLLYPDPDNYGESALNNFVGFKVLVHSPYDFAEVAAKGFVIDEHVESFIAGL